MEQENKVKIPPPPLELRKKQVAKSNTKNDDLQAKTAESNPVIDENQVVFDGNQRKTSGNQKAGDNLQMEEQKENKKRSKVSFFTIFCVAGFCVSISLAILFAVLICK